jgi:hypothetical protein
LRFVRPVDHLALPQSREHAILKGTFMRKARLVIALAVLLSGLCFAQGPAYPYTTNLSWVASTGTVTGYNIYRGPYTTSCPATASGYTKLTTTPLPATATSYADANPPQGSYCYFGTALSAQGESGPSNIDANVVIPPPPPTAFGATVATVNGIPETTFAWTQSTGKGLTGNKVHCKTPAEKAFVVTVDTTAPVDMVRMVQKPGTYLCEATVIAKTESGPSNQETITVP